MVRVPEPVYDVCRTLSNYYRRLAGRGDVESVDELIRGIEDLMAEHDMPSDKPVNEYEDNGYKAKYEELTGKLTQLQDAIASKEKGYQRNNAGKLIDSLLALFGHDPEM
jgi:SMC interacting uncharacterized protein involved in chromosome segregation